MNHEWLWDWLYWGLYQVHPQVVPYFHLAVLLFTYGLVWRLAWQISRSLSAAVLAVWAAAASAHWFLDLRPHVYTLLLTALWMSTCERPWRLWGWPLLTVVWTNLHAGFVFGVGAIGLHAVVASSSASIRNRRLVLPGREWLCVGLCALAMLLNPWGWRILEYPLDYLPGFSDTAYHGLVEWHPPRFAPDDWFGLGELRVRGLVNWLSTFQLRFGLVVALAALGVRRAARERPYLLALAGVALLMALRSRRFIPLFGICAVPIAALGLAGCLALLRAHLPVLETSRARVAAACAAFALALLWWRDVRLWPDLLGQWTQRDLYPQAAVRYLNALGPPTRVLNYYNWGGYLMLHAPGARVFIDGRANTLYDEQMLNDYGAMLAAEPGLRARVDRYRADVALLPNSGLSRALQELSPPWRVLYRDSSAVLLAPPDSPLLRAELPDPAEILRDEAQFLRQEAGRLWGAGERERAREQFERAIERDPLLMDAYTALADLLYTSGDIGGAERVLQRGEAASPRRWNDLRAAHARFLFESRQLGPALALLRSVFPTGPFSDTSAARRRIEVLLDVMNQEQADKSARSG
jgi:tetratricopeptide (TPR) repeat protein